MDVLVLSCCVGFVVGLGERSEVDEADRVS